ncbi:MAG TPA: hypothetical protein VG248_18955 [Caulobacteraceae bacterium]|jgi:hypothetical protein|nr:hypothetical protein [Caulobacteraceae bacterium]
MTDRMDDLQPQTLPEPLVEWQPTHHRLPIPTGALMAAALGGALAMGAIAIGAVAIGAVSIGRMRIGRLEVGRLDVKER